MNREYARKERLLTVQDVSLAYGDKLILRNINLAVDNIVRPNMHQGQVVALLGPSGVGKTQLFRMIAGLQDPSVGAVFLGDNKMEGQQNAQGEMTAVVTQRARVVQAGEVGVVFQSYPLLKHRTVWSNCKLAAHKHGVGNEQITFLLDRFGLTERKDQYPAQLSGGQRQRVAIIQQMLANTHFMLMDEPFSGLDVRMKQEVVKVIREVSIVDELNTAIVTTHDIDTACQIADTVWVLGFERDAAGARIPGAVVIKQFDLIERGIAWQEKPELHPNFIPTVREITQLFMQ